MQQLVRNNSDTSIAISTENKKTQALNKSLPRNPQNRDNLKCLEKFKKDNLSQVEENYEPSIGMSIDQKIEQNSSRNEVQQKINFIQNPKMSFKVLESPLSNNFKQEKKVQVKGGLNLIRLVTKFIKQLKTKSQLSKYKIINENTLKLIGDFSSSPKIFLQVRNHFFHCHHNINLKSIFESLSSFFEKIPIMQPDNLILLVYNSIVFLMLIINIAYLPLDLFWNEEAQLQQNFSVAFDFIPTIFCIFEMGFRLITSYYDEGILYKNKTKIVQYYLKNDFAIDFLSIFPVFNSYQIIQFLKIFRIIKLKRILANLEEILIFKQSLLGYWEFIKSIFFIVYSCHFFACIWHKIGVMGIENDATSWLEVKELQNTSFANQYCFSLYFIVITTLTIGYGDILPTNTNEALFTIFIAFTGCSVLGYTINNIGEIFKGLNEKNVKFKQQMKNIQQYLKDYKINYNLSLQIRKYFEYHLKAAIENNNEGQILIDQLSKQLKEQMQIDLYKKYLIKSQLVKNYCSDNTIDKLCQRISIENYAPESQIFKQGQTCENFYYVLEGELEKYITLGNEKEVCIVDSIQPNQFIGQWEFLISSPYYFSLKTKKLTKLLAINRLDFFKVLKENQEDFEKLNQVKDELLYLRKSWGKKCFVCGWIHYFTNCSFVFFVANREKIISEAIANVIQERNVAIVVRQYLKRKTFRNISLLRQAALDYIQEGESNDLSLQYLLDLGFNKNDSLLQGSSLHVDELIQNKQWSQLKIQENEDESNHSLKKSPKIIATYRNRSIILQPAENDSFLNLRLQTNDQLNRQSSVQQQRRQTREFSKIKQQKLQMSTKKIDSRMNFFRKNDQSNNFPSNNFPSNNFPSNNFPSQISSNLNNPNNPTKILSNPQNDLVGSQQESLNEHHSSIQPQQSIVYQLQQQMLPQISINMDIDKTFITKNYFEQGNLYQIVNKIIDLQVAKMQSQFKITSYYKHQSYKLASVRSIRKKHLAFQTIKNNSSQD